MKLHKSAWLDKSKIVKIASIDAKTALDTFKIAKSDEKVLSIPLS